MLLLILALYIIYISAYTGACPIYISKVSRTNYTDLVIAIANANSSTQVHICDGFVLNSTDPITISKDVRIVGDMDTCGGGAYFNAGAVGFIINGTANVEFQSIRFIFNATLMTVLDDAQLTLTHVNMLNGVTAVALSPSFSNQSPFIGTGVMFQFMDVGIQLSRSVSVACQYCRFQSLKVAALTTPSSDISLLSLPYVVVEDVLVFVGLKTSSSAITTINIPDSFILCNELAVCHSFSSTCTSAVQSQSPIFGSGGGGGGGSKASENGCSDCRTEKWLLVGLFILMGIASIALVVRTVASQKTYNAQQ